MVAQIFFRRTKIFTRKYFANIDSEPEAARLSSVKNVTATQRSANRVYVLLRTNEERRPSDLIKINNRSIWKLETRNRKPRTCPLPSAHLVIYTYRLP